MLFFQDAPTVQLLISVAIRSDVRERVKLSMQGTDVLYGFNPLYAQAVRVRRSAEVSVSYMLTFMYSYIHINIYIIIRFIYIRMYSYT